jgi:hypothetical protein
VRAGASAATVRCIDAVTRRDMDFYVDAIQFGILCQVVGKDEWVEMCDLHADEVGDIMAAAWL